MGVNDIDSVHITVPYRWLAHVKAQKIKALLSCLAAGGWTKSEFIGGLDAAIRLFGLQDFSHIDLVTASGPGQTGRAALAGGEHSVVSQAAMGLSAKLRLAHYAHLFHSPTRDGLSSWFKFTLLR
jgi:hypothetical protein